MERYHALRDGVSADDAIRTDIDVILGRASAALRLARQAPKTAIAEAVLKRHAAEAAAAVQQTPDPAAAAARAGPQPPASRRERPPAAAPRRRGDARAAAAHAGPDTPPSGRRRPAVASRRLAGPPRRPTPRRGARRPGADAPAGRPDDSMRTAAPGASDFEGRAQIEHLLMEGEVRMTVADYANAVKVYEKLVSVAPKVAAFRLRLAVAMACYPRTAKLAEREFYEARAARARQRRGPLPVGPLLQGDEDQEPRRRRDAHGRAPEPEAQGRPRRARVALAQGLGAHQPQEDVPLGRRRRRSPGPDRELVEERERHEHERELRLVGGAVLGRAPEPGGREQHRDHQQHDGRGAREAERAVPGG